MATKHFTISLQFSNTMEVLNRGDRALLIIKDEENRFILGCKTVYPHGIYRLPGGGIDAGEDPQVAASRELGEELGLIRTPQEMTPEAKIDVTVTSEGKSQIFSLYLYSTELKRDEVMKPADDLTDIVRLSREEMNSLVDRFYDLSDEVIAKAEKNGTQSTFRWSDYGKLYGRVHEIVLELA